jgi:hypothetical protein
MPNKRIDQLDANLNPLTGQELIPIFDKNTNTTERISIDTLASYIDISDDTITGGTYNNTTKTLTLEKNGGTEINITGFTDFYTTGATLNGTTLEFNRTDSSNAYLVDLSSLKFTGNTSGDCISDIHVSNIHSCSPLRINPNDEGDVYFGSSNSVVIDVISGTISANTLSIFGVNITGDTYVTSGTYISGGTITFDYNNGGSFNLTGLTSDLDTAISELAEADETTVTLNPVTNKIELKSTIGPADGGTRSFEGNIVFSGGNVGIGTNNPNNALDVIGNLSVSNSISATTYYGDGSNLINLPSGGETFTGGTVSGDTNFLNTVTASILSATTIYGDGSNLINLPNGGSVFTGGTVTGPTEFTNGLTTDTIYSPSFIGDGSQLSGVVGLTYSDLGFTITSPPPVIINQNVVLPYNSTVTYPSPLIMGSGYTITIPIGTTLTII